jgi:acetyltransferase-like isoleucine patch superfamily enzyme
VLIGNNTYIGNNTNIICREKIFIGNNVQISWNVTIYDHDGNSLDFLDRRKEVNNYFKNYCSGDMLKDFQWEKVKTSPITIKDDVWIGFGVTILKGVTIGEGSIVGANSVVTKDVDPNTFVAGNPAVYVKKVTRL